jgi:hypothetical protein
MSLLVTLMGKANDGGGYHWRLGLKDQPLLAMSRDYRTRHEMKQELIAVLTALQKDDFDFADYSDDDAGKPKHQSHVVSITKAPLRNKVGWQVTSTHGWGILMYGETCPCKKGEPMALFEKEVVVGIMTFEITKHSPSRAGCDVYIVGPGQAPLPLSLDKQRKQ